LATHALQFIASSVLKIGPDSAEGEADGFWSLAGSLWGWVKVDMAVPFCG
jgi:hypothetical protein